MYPMHSLCTDFLDGLVNICILYRDLQGCIRRFHHKNLRHKYLYIHGLIDHIAYPVGSLRYIDIWVCTNVLKKYLNYIIVCECVRK